MKKRYGIFFFGVIVLTLGVALVMRGGLGSGSWDAVNVGIHQQMSISVGSSAIFVSIGFLLLAGILRHNVFRYQTFFAAIALGVCTDVWILVLQQFTFTPHFIISLGLTGIGIACTSIGLGFYLYANIVLNPLDDFMMVFKELLSLNVGMAKLIVDGSGVLLAFVLGAPLGIGTILATCLVGPLSAPVYHFLEDRYNSL